LYAFFDLFLIFFASIFFASVKVSKPLSESIKEEEIEVKKDEQTEANVIEQTQSKEAEKDPLADEQGCFAFVQLTLIFGQKMMIHSLFLSKK
jgi:hypothetical protein